ncbi:hypothetical protein E3N88_32104 [Mikania micrantha]|uniref:Uncharacterized protein n=1 Tax=Mikania micrantha TaxID=192012 RepID=A0A5N6M7H3_9ASTR|nr:hypothetical protein E3N88_32104 [Mikania micrantha]
MRMRKETEKDTISDPFVCVLDLFVCVILGFGVYLRDLGDAKARASTYEVEEEVCERVSRKFIYHRMNSSRYTKATLRFLGDNVALAYLPTGSIFIEQNGVVRKDLDMGPMVIFGTVYQYLEYHIILSMANLGERYIHQRIPYVILDDTPSSSEVLDSDSSLAASRVVPRVSHTPPLVPQTPPPYPHVSDEDTSAVRRAKSPSTQRVPVFTGVRRIRDIPRLTILVLLLIISLKQFLNEFQV